MAKTYLEAHAKAVKLANETGSSVLVYVSKLGIDADLGHKYGIAHTLPAFGERVGDRIYPEQDRLRNGARNDGSEL